MKKLIKCFLSAEDLKIPKRFYRDINSKSVGL